MNIKQIIKNLFLYIKYRNFYFRKEGKRCNYKGIYSKFIYPRNISLGNDVWIGKGADFDGKGGIEIGNGVIFAPEVIIYTRSHNFKENLQALPFDNIMFLDKVVIKDYVAVGRRAIILPGVTIGKGAVIGAGAVVFKDIPDYGIAFGNPARIVGYRNKQSFQRLYNEKESFGYNNFKHKKEYRVK